MIRDDLSTWATLIRSGWLPGCTRLVAKHGSLCNCQHIAACTGTHKTGLAGGEGCLLGSLLAVNSTGDSLSCNILLKDKMCIDSAVCPIQQLLHVTLPCRPPVQLGAGPAVAPGPRPAAMFRPATGTTPRPAAYARPAAPARGNSRRGAPSPYATPGTHTGNNQTF